MKRKTIEALKAKNNRDGMPDAAYWDSQRFWERAAHSPAIKTAWLTGLEFQRFR
jgi:hypothetical protein